MPNADRQRGTLLGLAVGDALGAAVEFEMPGSFQPVTGYRGGGSHGLGPWHHLCQKERSTDVQCSNCGKEIPDVAQICEFCEASVQLEPSEEEKQAVWEMLEQMGPEAQEALRKEFRRSKTAEEFANRIMVGECPQCGSEDTDHCEHDPEVNEILVGRCYDCGQLWCTECSRLLDPDAPFCGCWAEDE